MQNSALARTTLFCTILYCYQNFISFAASDGCTFDPDSDIFKQNEDTSSPVENWGWKWTTNISVVPNNVGWPIYKWMPDGHISPLKVELPFSI